MTLVLTSGEITALRAARQYPLGPIGMARAAERRRAERRRAIESAAMAVAGLLTACALAWAAWSP